MTLVHPTAVVDPRAQLAPDVEIEEHAFRAPGTTTRVVASPFGRDVRLVGSLALALHDLFYAPTLELRPRGGPRRAAV